MVDLQVIWNIILIHFMTIKLFLLTLNRHPTNSSNSRHNHVHHKHYNFDHYLVVKSVHRPWSSDNQMPVKRITKSLINANRVICLNTAMFDNKKRRQWRDTRIIYVKCPMILIWIGVLFIEVMHFGELISPSAAYMRRWIGSPCQIMACRLFSAKPLSKTMLCYCQLDS